MPRIIKPAVGSFTASNITIDSSGRVVAASSGAGAANMIRTHQDAADGTRTFTAQPGSSKLHIYLRGAGGGGGGGTGGSVGRTGGNGGFGFFNVPISQPYSAPYTLGAGGSGGNPDNNSGSAGAASSFNTNLVANGGGGGGGLPGTVGAPGTLQNETFAYIDGNPFAESMVQVFVPEGMADSKAATDTTGISHFQQTTAYRIGPTYLNPGDLRLKPGGIGGIGGSGPNTGYLDTPTTKANPGRAGTAGSDGGLVVYEDIG